MNKTLLPILLLASGFLHAEVRVSNLELKGGDEASRKAYFAQSVRLWGHSKYPKDPQERINLVTLANARCSFLLKLQGRIDSQGKLHAQLGMLKPSSANWFGNGFFSFNVNGVSPSDASVEIVNMSSGPDRGSVTFLYSGKDFTAKLTVTLADNDDKLLLEFKPEYRGASAQKKTCEVSFLCYPSSYAGGWKAGLRLRKREALTPLRTLSENGKYISLGNGEPWILFYDLAFDVKDNRGEGPCALMFDPKECVSKKVVVENYACGLKFQYPMNTAAHFILWDFHGWSNESARQFMNSLVFK